MNQPANLSPDPESETRAAHAMHATPPYMGIVATALCLTFGLSAAYFHFAWESTVLTWTFGIGAYLAGGFGPVLNAWDSLKRRQLNVDLLMIIAAIGAACIGDLLEGVVLLFLFSLSGTLEAFALYRTSRSIESLIQLRPSEANLVIKGGNEDRRVKVDSLRIGDLVRVKPGDRFPVDGLVKEGQTWADESTLTGESEPITKMPGANVFAGTINGQGSVLVEMAKEPKDTTLEKIVQMVQEAQGQKTQTQRFVESWQQPYVIGVLTAALVVFFGVRLFHDTLWSGAFYHAMVLLVAASPCAVVVSSPSVMLSAIARAGRHGVLFKSAVHLEALGKVETIAFDKTGTLTKGKPGVVDIWVAPTTDLETILELAATIELHSEHPLGVPIVQEARSKGINPGLKPVTDFQSRTGLGVHGRVGGTWVGIGREGLFQANDQKLPKDLCAQAALMREKGWTALLVLTDDPKVHGAIAVADKIRPEAKTTVDALKKLGIRKVVMLTGDHERVAATIAQSLHVDEVRAGLLPDQKVGELRRLKEDGQIVAMVGDGVNDAPALAAAGVGIAMGGAGSDVALDVADVVLMRDDLRGLPLAVWIGRVAEQRVRQNMVFSFSMIAILVLGTFFNLPLWLGVLGHEGSTVIVVFNGLRLLWEKAPKLVEAV